MAIELDMATAWQLNHSIQKITIAKFLAQILKKIDKVQKTKKGSPENPKNIEKKRDCSLAPNIHTEILIDQKGHLGQVVYTIQDMRDKELDPWHQFGDSWCVCRNTSTAQACSNLAFVPEAKKAN